MKFCATQGWGAAGNSLKRVYIQVYTASTGMAFEPAFELFWSEIGYGLCTLALKSKCF